MKVLLVEDEEHKANDLTTRILANGVSREHLVHTKGVREAVLSVLRAQFDLIVLDMALPIFSDGGPDGSGGGTAQVVGGLEVLRALKSSGASTKVIIVTQYSDVILNGENVRLANVPRLLSERYGQVVLGCVLYSFNTPEWENRFDQLMSKDNEGRRFRGRR